MDNTDLFWLWSDAAYSKYTKNEYFTDDGRIYALMCIFFWVM